MRGCLAKTEKRFSATMLTAVALTIRYKRKKNKEKKTAQGIAFNIFIVKANMIKMPLIPLIHCDHIWALHNLIAQSGKREIRTP